MNWFQRCIGTLKIEISYEFQTMREIFQVQIRSLSGNLNCDLSPIFAWRFWRKFLAMGSTGGGAALGWLLLNKFTPVKMTGGGRVPMVPVWKVLGWRQGFGSVKKGGPHEKLS